MRKYTIQLIVALMLLPSCKDDDEEFDTYIQYPVFDPAGIGYPNDYMIESGILNPGILETDSVNNDNPNSIVLYGHLYASPKKTDVKEYGFRVKNKVALTWNDAVTYIIKNDFQWNFEAKDTVVVFKLNPIDFPINGQFSFHPYIVVNNTLPLPHTAETHSYSPGLSKNFILI